jgi:hypothetical protein
MTPDVIQIVSDPDDWNTFDLKIIANSSLSWIFDFGPDIPTTKKYF